MGTKGAKLETMGPNGFGWLLRGRPVDLLESNLPQVLEAARIDRFIAAQTQFRVKLNYTLRF